MLEIRDFLAKNNTSLVHRTDVEYWQFDLIDLNQNKVVWRFIDMVELDALYGAKRFIERGNHLKDLELPRVLKESEILEMLKP